MPGWVGAGVPVTTGVAVVHGPIQACLALSTEARIDNIGEYASEKETEREKSRQHVEVR